MLRGRGRALENRGLAVRGSSLDVPNPLAGLPKRAPRRGGLVGVDATDTKRQERRARRFLPYNQSMGRLGNAVKLRK